MYEHPDTRSPSMVPTIPPWTGFRYAGPERRCSTSLAWRWLAAMLDEIDYGLLLLSDEAHVLHANRVARAELDDAHPLQLLDGALRARRLSDVAPLHAALQGATKRGLRKLLALGEPGQHATISVVPLGRLGSDGRNAILVILGKRHVCAELAVQGFAHSRGLTPCEARVLAELCAGRPPAEIAARHCVAISTVRSQIGSIRLKTDAPSIRALVRLVAVLPPLMGILRPGGASAESSNDTMLLTA